MDEYNSFSKYIDTLEKREAENELSAMLGGIYSAPGKLKRREIKSRLSLITEEKIHSVVNIILTKTNVAINVLNDELKRSIMEYDTKLRKSLPRGWKATDFEELRFVLIGQKE